MIKSRIGPAQQTFLKFINNFTTSGLTNQLNNFHNIIQTTELFYFPMKWGLKEGFQLMQILGLLDIYFDAAVLSICHQPFIYIQIGSGDTVPALESQI